MNRDSLYATESTKDNNQFVKDLTAIATRKGFTVHNRETMDMARSFKSHGIDTREDFDLHMIQVCKPEKAAKSLQANPERAVLMPKFIMTFSGNGRTQIRFLHYDAETIRAIVDDDDFPAALAGTYETIISMIEEAR